MGNTIVKDPKDDFRFGDSLLAKEIKNIMINQEVVYDKKNNIKIKPHIAKACCYDVIKGNPAEQEIISIAFPRAITKDSDECKKYNICNSIGLDYVGFQIDATTIVPNNAEETTKATQAKINSYCSKENVGISLNNTRPGGAGFSSCDNFMINSCGKYLYDTNCIYVDPVDKQPKFIKPGNKKCWTVTKDINSGPPECTCINSLAGHNLNTQPNEAYNVYGLIGSSTSLENKSPYSLDIFKIDSGKQKPIALDKRCGAGYNRNTTNESRAWTRPKEDEPVTFCINQATFTNFTAEEINIKNFNMTCASESIPVGTSRTPTTPTTSTPSSTQQQASENVTDASNINNNDRVNTQLAGSNINGQVETSADGVPREQISAPPATPPPPPATPPPATPPPATPPPATPPPATNSGTNTLNRDSGTTSSNESSRQSTDTRTADLTETERRGDGVPQRETTNTRTVTDNGEVTTTDLPNPITPVPEGGTPAPSGGTPAPSGGTDDTDSKKSSKTIDIVLYIVIGIAAIGILAFFGFLLIKAFKKNPKAFTTNEKALGKINQFVKIPKANLKQ